MPNDTIRATLTLPSELVEAADRLVRAGMARSRNDLVATALRRELAAQRRAAIDAEFALMAGDKEALEEAQQLTREFAQADWEAFRIGERQYSGEEG